MDTIRRNWTKRVAEIRAAARYCRAYESSTGNMADIDPARAFAAWAANPRATLSEDVPGQKWTVHVHSNSFYILTTTDPAQRRTAARPARATTARPVRSATEDAVLQEAREYIKDAPGIGARTAAAATAAIGHRVQSGTLVPDHLTEALPRMAAAVTAKAVADMRAQGLTHEQIRQRFERKKAEALHAGNARRATVADAMLTVHAGIVADEERKAPPVTGPAPELESAAPELGPAPEARFPTATASAPAIYVGVPVPALVRNRWCSELADGWRLGIRTALANS
ncbi:hypothetical protein [Streptomyces qinglanensis]|uniref:hypothetical protein n=1 Tax=Streptomyces qinglanensis TaxID=943816 RepID=UPI003D74EB7B